jgi:hypothetical protein
VPQQAFEKAVAAAEPSPSTVAEHVFASNTNYRRKGNTTTCKSRKNNYGGCALHAIEELMQAA